MATKRSIKQLTKFATLFWVVSMVAIFSFVYFSAERGHSAYNGQFRYDPMTGMTPTGIEEGAILAVSTFAGIILPTGLYVVAAVVLFVFYLASD